MDLKLQRKSKAIYAFLMALLSVWGWAQSVTIIPDKTTTGNNSNTYVTALTNFTARILIGQSNNGIPLIYR